MQPDRDLAQRVVTMLNGLLASDGWSLVEQSIISGRSIFGPRRLADSRHAIGAAHNVAAVIYEDYIARDRIHDMVCLCSRDFCLESPMPDMGPHTNFVFEAGKVLPQFVAKSVTRILGIRKDNGPADHRGTALMCHFEGRQALVTANHVLTEIEKSGNYRAVGISAVRGGFQAQYMRFADIDVAIIRPESEISIPAESSLWPGEWCDRHEPAAVMAADYMLVYGFPARFSRFSTFLPGSISEGYTHCTWVRPLQSQAQEPLWKSFAEMEGYPPIPDELLQPWQFCLNFDEPTGPLKTQGGEVVTSRGILQEHAGLYVDLPTLPGSQPFGAFGLSGSPVWRFGAAEAGWSLDRWSPESARLVGIITHWNEERSYLMATRFSEIAARMAIVT